MVMEKNMWEKVGEVFTSGPDPKRCSTNLSHLGWFFMYDIFKSIGVLNKKVDILLRRKNTQFCNII